MSSKLAIVLPAYNEEEVFPLSLPKLIGILERMIQDEIVTANSTICFVDDGSKDKTWELIEKATEEHSFVEGIKLSRNFGHQSAILAGMMELYDRFDCLITMDADLQDDIELLPKMVKSYQKGDHIVFGVKKSRKKDGFLKRFTAERYYAFLKSLGANTIANHADFRLMSKESLKALSEYKEGNLYLRGIVSNMGYPSSKVYEDLKEREAGESKYTVLKMLTLAWDGITSFSTKPLKLATFLGFFTFFISLVLVGYVLYAKFNHLAIPGWSSTLIPLLFLGGVQLFILGIIGEYIAKIYSEVKNRPRYIIEKQINREKN